MVIALATTTIFLSDRADVLMQALAFDEHEEAPCQLVRRGAGHGTSRAAELMGLGIELEGSIH